MHACIPFIHPFAHVGTASPPWTARGWILHEPGPGRECLRQKGALCSGGRSIHPQLFLSPVPGPQPVSVPSHLSPHLGPSSSPRLATHRASAILVEDPRATRKQSQGPCLVALTPSWKHLWTRPLSFMPEGVTPPPPPPSSPPPPGPCFLVKVPQSQLGQTMGANHCPSVSLSSKGQLRL